MSILELKNICKTYGNKDNKIDVLKNINLNISEGEMIAIIGPSGSGKSTLLNIIGCLDTPSNGTYLIENNSVNILSNKKLAVLRNELFGFVVQYFALIDDYTVFQNIKIPLSYSKTKKGNIKSKINSALQQLGIEDKKDKYPPQLSGGQNQRVAIARALINDPKIILADEPTGALDQETGNDVMNLFESLNNNGKTIILVTHDKNIAERCKRIISIKDGKIISDIKNAVKYGVK